MEELEQNQSYFILHAGWYIQQLYTANLSAYPIITCFKCKEDPRSY